MKGFKADYKNHGTPAIGGQGSAIRESRITNSRGLSQEHAGGRACQFGTAWVGLRLVHHHQKPSSILVADMIIAIARRRSTQPVTMPTGTGRSLMVDRAWFVGDSGLAQAGCSSTAELHVMVD